MTEAMKTKKLTIAGVEGALEQLDPTNAKATREAEKARQAEVLELTPAKLLEAGRMIPLKQLVESKKNHRRAFGDLEGLGESMLKQGQLTSVWVVAVNPGVFEVIAGARRLRAAKKVGIDELKCDVYEATPEQAAEMRVIENAQREDLKPIEEAENCEELQQLGYTPATIAKKLGKSVGWVHGRLKLLNLGPSARTLLYSGALPGSVALVLGRFPKANQQSALDAMEKSYGVLKRLDNDNPGDWKDAENEKVGLAVNARRAIDFLQEQFMKSLKGAPFDVTDTTLNPERGACGSCSQNTDNQPLAEGEVRPAHPFCCDLPCYKLKTEAAWKLTTAKAEEKGAEVLTVAEAKGALNGIDYRTGSRYVKTSQKAFEDPKGRTYAQLVGELPKDQQPAIVIAPDENKKPVKLYERALVEKALAEAGFKWADKKAARKASTSSGPSPAKLKEQREKDEARERVSLEALRQVVDNMRKKPNVGDVRALALAALNAGVGDDVAAALEEHCEGDGIASLFGVKPATRAGMKSWVEKKAKLNDLIALAYVLEVGNDYAEVSGGFSAEVKESATRHKIDLKKLEQLDEQANTPKADEKGEGGKAAA